MSQNNKPNKLLDFLNVDLPDIKRSNVNLTRSNRFSASFGYIYPTLVEEILPSDRVRGNIRTILKSNPTINSIYGSARQSHQAYFVPLRFYIKELDQNFTFNPPVSNAPSVAPFPTIHWDGQDDEGLTVGPSEGFVNPGSLLEMLEMFPAFSSMRSFYKWEDEDSPYGFSSIPPINAIPLIAYYDIVRNYYFNSQELEMPFIQYEFADPNSESGNLNDRTYVTYNLVSKSILDEFISDVYDGYYSNTDLDLLARLSNKGIYLLSPNPITAVNEGGQYYRNVHHGYAVRCFDDDYFTTALSNDYVEALDSSARVNISQQGNQYSFAVSQLQRARQMARHVSRDILGGTNYDDYIYVHFNTKLGRELNKPYFLGSASNDFFFEDIYQMAQNEDRQLGSRAGKLEASATFNDFIDFEASEYGYLIVLSSLIPRITYFAGIPKKYLKTSMSDLYSPEFDAWGFQGIPALEVTAQSQMPIWEYDSPLDYVGHVYDYNNRPTSNSFDLYGSPRYIGLSEVRKQPAWFEHMASYDRVHGLLVSDLEQSFSVLHKSYVPGVDTAEEMLSTYIRPWEFNYIFQYQSSWFDNFTWQILFDLNIYRPISKQILPSY